jgi:hypothetical protein
MMPSAIPFPTRRSLRFAFELTDPRAGFAQAAEPRSSEPCASASPREPPALAEPILAPASLETQRRGDPNLAPLRLGASLPSATLFTMAPSHSPLSEKQIRLRLSFSVSSMDSSAIFLA